MREEPRCGVRRGWLEVAEVSSSITGMGSAINAGKPLGWWLVLSEMGFDRNKRGGGEG